MASAGPGAVDDEDQCVPTCSPWPTAGIALLLGLASLGRYNASPVEHGHSQWIWQLLGPIPRLATSKLSVCLATLCGLGLPCRQLVRVVSLGTWVGCPFPPGLSAEGAVCSLGSDAPLLLSCSVPSMGLGPLQTLQTPRTVMNPANSLEGLYLHKPNSGPKHTP